jgi:hypothetical protein
MATTNISSKSKTRIASGRTMPGATAWQQYPGGAGIYVDVDTSAAQLTITPVYVTSLGGNSSHWATTGASSVYQATATGFRVYVRWDDGGPLTPATAHGFQWHINWIGMEI